MENDQKRNLAVGGLAFCYTTAVFAFGQAFPNMIVPFNWWFGLASVASLGLLLFFVMYLRALKPVLPESIVRARQADNQVPIEAILSYIRFRDWKLHHMESMDRFSSFGADLGRLHSYAKIRALDIWGTTNPNVGHASPIDPEVWEDQHIDLGSVLQGEPRTDFSKSNPKHREHYHDLSIDWRDVQMLFPPKSRLTRWLEKAKAHLPARFL